ncbi:ABC transporter substrate-binding protein [Limnohabitans sp. JirII-31]|uniref:ABC transporter substrate-binding protein n=1 Tax=Limnohabitans sp. JirII-31 TaxID=1977908 RepID=UPI000C1F37A0|nr:ABC transporter substrate-binding protein [Limnohabitans sp. JirII-31]PIT79389.1 ABC transporter substrate-binding protein [Limnohabitans sp. JirII-31]
MDKRSLIKAMVAAPIVMGLNPASAQNKPFKIGLLTPMTGPFASTGKQMLAGVKLYMAQQGVNIAGRQVELIVKDDTGMPDVTKRLAQELVVNDKVDVLAGFGLTPLALATGPIATQSKTPMVNMLAATSSVIDASPYMVRVSMTLPQITVGVAEWASKNNIRKVVTLVSDYGPGIDAERTFVDRFLLNGGQVLESLRVPMRSPDFSPFLQKVRDLSPDAVFVFVPSGIGTQVMKQFNERGLARAGIRLIGTGDVVDDDILNSMGDATLGIVTSYPYSTDHPSALNKKFVAEFKKANQNMRPNAVAVFGYDGTRLIYEALKKTAGKGGGDALLAAMKGQIFESPRGQIYIDANTRDIVQSVYVRKVEKVNGELYNVEFQEQKDVRDPPRAR